MKPTAQSLEKEVESVGDSKGKFFSYESLFQFAKFLSNLAGVETNMATNAESSGCSNELPSQPQILESSFHSEFVKSVPNAPLSDDLKKGEQ